MAAPATPQRNLNIPGAFQNTPAVPRTQGALQRPGGLFQYPPNPVLSRSAAPQQNTQLAANQGAGSATLQTNGTQANGTQSSNPIERAARIMNQNLSMEQRFPALDDYIIQGISSEYDIPASQSWAPFQKVRTYEIPDRIFEQYNQAEMSTSMGLFAELQHAWVTIDNALYIWDYTHPNPELIGFEEQTHTIHTVQLVKPRKGVFVANITHLLVVATATDVFLLGLAATTNDAGVQTVALYQTGMQVPIKGVQVRCIAGSAKTGRIFFGCGNSTDVYEVTYQQEEKWFFNKCGKINHTADDVISSITPQSLYSKFAAITGTQAGQEYINQIEVDDTRDLLYTLSSSSTIRVFHIKQPSSLNLVITKKLSDIITHIGHMVPRATLFTGTQKISSISPIPVTESSRLALMATMGTGVRVYLSATSGTYYYTDATNTPSSMQVQHIKFPPPFNAIQPAAPGQTPPSNQITSYSSSAVDTESRSLIPTRAARRYSPGFYFNIIDKGQNDSLFISAPESGRLARPQETSSLSRFVEAGQWVFLGSKAEDMGVVTPPFAAAKTPAGFGNEMAVQFDQSATEVAVLTNAGVQVFRRRRLVDVFAGALRASNTDEDFENTIKKFVRLYGRTETCACAVAVACGQGIDVGADARIGNINDPNVIEFARRTFIEHGGKPDVHEVLDASQSQVDSVRPSPRAEGLILYTTRLVRSLWKSPIIAEGKTPTGGLSIRSTLPIAKLQEVSRALTQLREFLEANRTYIAGLTGPEEMNRVASINEQVALQAEHRVLDAQVKTIANTIEGIAFLIQLFEQPVDEIFLSLPDGARQRFKQLSYEGLFTTTEGKELAKELVKAIVNRSIAAGSNVDTVADTLRRRCGSFCSADDVVIFKAQEQLQKASEAGAESANSRSLLNESLRLFVRVAGSLPTDYLEAAVNQYLALSFFAGAIQLCLSVAQQRDRANRALAWIKDDRPSPDSRANIYERRVSCYAHIWRVIEAVDATSPSPTDHEAVAANVVRRKQEAYNVIDASEDEVFQTSLYDWYLQRGWSDRLLELNSPFVIAYLERRSVSEPGAADLLWRYHAHRHNYFEAAKVQLTLATSGFPIDLPARIEYLSRAKANASTRVPSFGRLNNSRQEVLREINDQLDNASVQLEVLRRLEDDQRLLQNNDRDKVLEKLNGRVMTLDELYHDYVLAAGYHDICLVIYYLSDYRNSADISATWVNFIQETHQQALQTQGLQQHDVVQEKVRSVGRRVNCSETVFNTQTVLTLLLDYVFQTISQQHPDRTRGNREWPVDVLIDVGVPFESVLSTLENNFYNNELEWSVNRRRIVGALIVHVSERWLQESASGGGVPFGGVENTAAVLEALRAVHEAGLLAGRDRDALRSALERVQRLL